MKKRVAIVGATGLVGRMFLKVMEERNFPAQEIIPYASEKSAGESVSFKGKRWTVVKLEETEIRECDLALFSAGRENALKWAPKFAEKGALVVDNSSAFRGEEDIQLIVPEVNPEDINKHRGIIANPNCSTIGLVVALYPLHRKFGLKSVVVTSFQSVSGGGQEPLAELEREMAGEGFNPAVFYGRRIAGNCLPQIGDFLESGETVEESKFRYESRKMMHIPGLEVTATAVRAPIKVGHSLSVHARFGSAVDIEEARAILDKAAGVKLFAADSAYPTALDAAGGDLVLVGRVRKAEGFDNTLNLWVVLDNLRKGAATNAVQIAEMALMNQDG